MSSASRAATPRRVARATGHFTFNGARLPTSQRDSGDPLPVAGEGLMGNFDTMKLGEDFFEGREDSDPDELLRKLHLLVSRGGAAGTLADMQARRAGFERRYGRVAVTEDAVRKMAAFYLRWEAGLPTVVIGEAGCGKTMLVRFFAELMGFAFEAVTMDGGTTREQVVDLLLRAARVNAWLDGRDHLRPLDVRAVFGPCIAHRLSLTPAYELRREALLPALVEQLLARVGAP